MKITIGKKLHRRYDAGALEISTDFISAEELYDEIRLYLFDKDLKVDLDDFR